MWSSAFAAIPLSFLPKQWKKKAKQSNTVIVVFPLFKTDNHLASRRPPPLFGFVPKRHHRHKKRPHTRDFVDYLPRKFGGFYLVLFDLSICLYQEIVTVFPVTDPSYGVDKVVKNFFDGIRKAF